MDIQTIDNQYNQLQSQAQQTVAELQSLAGKLQSAAQAGDQNAREWFLDLKSIALAIQAEQNQVSNLLQALHGFVANQAQQMPQSPWGNAPAYPPQPAYPQQGGGILGGFLNSGFGRALEMGAGFGIGDEIINKIF
jgi:uncharacterized phage infection (PIP) family protein YhgE